MGKPCWGNWSSAGVWQLATVLALVAVPSDARTINDHRDPSRGGGAYALNAGPVFEMKLDLQPGQRMTCETRNASPRADPVIHILKGDNPEGLVTEVARDDDSAGNLNARVSFASPAGGRHLLVLRAAGPGAGGTADLFCDGRQVWPAVAVGGAFKRLEGLRASETLTTVTLPGGPRLHQLYGLDQAGRMLRRHDNGDTESAIFTAAATPVMVAMVGSKWPDPAGDVRLVRNDKRLPGADPDGDGLGKELERAIGTCSTRSEAVGNWDCSRSADARDTDGDGLTDGLELLGAVSATPYQWLPRWGANPLHKDLFVEVDYGAASPGDAPQRLSPDKARAFAAIYADPETSPVLRLRNAQALNNPDGQPGIALHFDSGVSPPANASPPDLVLYGDWGGHDVAAPVQVNGGWQRADAGQVWSSMMTPRRRGMFHHVLAYPDGGGQAPIHAFALNMPLASPDVAAHELGHTLGLDHSGPTGVGPGANCKPNYPTIMSYAFVGQPMSAFVPSFSDGYGRAALNNVNLPEVNAVGAPSGPSGVRYLAHLSKVFGYSVDAAAGSVDWNRDGVMSPTPVRAYANNNRGGCEFTRVNAIRSVGLSDGAVALARLQDRTFLGYVDERDRKIHVSRTDHPMDCLIIGQPCGSLSDAVLQGSWNRNIRSLDMHPVTGPAGQRMLIVFRSDSGLFEVLMAQDGSISGLRTIARGPQPDTELSLAGSGAQIWLGARNAAGNPVIRSRAANGAWSAEAPVAGVDGSIIGPLADGTSPGLLHASWPGGERKLLAAFPMAPDGSISLFGQDGNTGRWQLLPWSNPPEGTIGRPALAMEPVADGAPIPGRLRLMYLRASPTGNRIVKMRTLDANGIGPAAAPRMVAEDHDNVWYYGNGVDMLFEPGKDSNLRAAVATALLAEGVPQPRVVELRPLADGIVNFIQRNWDDWDALGVSLCLMRQKGGAAVTCHPWGFKPPLQTTGTPAPLPQSTPSPSQPTTPPTAAQCRSACQAELQQCNRDGGSVNICRSAARLCMAQCR